MYLETFDSFQQHAEELYKANPLKTRYVIKYRHCDGKLVLKVTDDTTCLQYKTDKQADLKRVGKLNDIFFSLMATGEPPSGDVEMEDKLAAHQTKGRRNR